MGIIRASSEWADREETVKQRLRSYRKLVSQHEACRDLLEQIQPALTAQVTCDRIVSLGPNRIEEKMHRRIDLEQQMAKSLQAMLDEMSGIMELIGRLEGDEYTLILRRYTLNEDMDKIADGLHLCARTCWRIHERAIKRLTKSCQ